MPLEFNSGFGANSLIWVSSLSPEQQGPTRRIVEDIRPWSAQIGLPFIRYDPKSAGELYQLLDGIAQRAREGAKPMLHFDMHGSKHGLHLAGTLEIAPWARVVSKFQAINVATGNNLVVAAGVCFARNAILEIKISEACPVYMLIAPETEVTFGFLEDNTVWSFF